MIASDRQPPAGDGRLPADLRDQVRRSPLWALGLGVAAGYVLGGGVGLRTAGQLLVAAGRAAVWSVVTMRLAEAGGPAPGGRTRGRPPAR